MRLGTGCASSVLMRTRMRWFSQGLEQMVDDVEALLAVGIVDAANVDQRAEAAEGIVAQQRDHLDDVVAGDLDGELAERDMSAE